MLQALHAFILEARAMVPWREFLALFFSFSFFLLCWYKGMCLYFIHFRKDSQPLSSKRKAWFLSFIVSCLSTPIGIYYALRIFSPSWDPAEMLETDATPRMLLTLFWTYLIIDMCVGFVEYKEDFGVLSGWVHHIFYGFFLIHAYVRGYSMAFAFTLVMESSSIFLSGGRLFPCLRQDWVFGLLFFTFRIVYHFYLLWKLIGIPAPRVVMWPPVAGVWVLHIYWLWGWVEGMRRKWRRRKEGGGEELASPYGQVERKGKEKKEL